MSIKNKIRSIKLNNNVFDVYIVFPEESDTFSIPYIFAIPEEFKDGTKLIVETNNLERRHNGRNLDFNNPSDREYLIDDGISDVLGNKRFFGKIEYADLVSAPMIMPIIPTTDKGVPYFQQLSEECFDSKIVDKEFKRIDKQVESIILHVKSDISEDRNVKLADKIFLMGYSTSGVFAQRFALCHPDIIDTVLIGGAIGSIPVPGDINGKNNLDYPLGIRNYKSITGKSFDENSYRNIRFNYYVAENENIPKSISSFDELGRKAPMHDMSYMRRSVPREVGNRQRELYGRNIWKRFERIYNLYKNNGFNISSKVIKGKEHRNVQLSYDDFKRVYNGESILKENEKFNSPNIFTRTINGVKSLGKRIYNTLFKKERNKLLPSESTNYIRMVNSIDIDGLSVDFENELKRNNIDKKIDEIIKARNPKVVNGKIVDYGLKTKVNPKDIAVLTRMFFEHIGEEYGKKVEDILLGKNDGKDGKQYIGFKMYKKDLNQRFYYTRFDRDEHGLSIYEPDSCVTPPRGKNNDIGVYVVLNGDISDLYDAVHEITHTFDTKKGDTTTRRVAGEILPQIMERELDLFLLGLSNEELERYGINKDDLEEDINTRRLYSYITRYKNSSSLNKNEGKAVKDRRYVLSLIASTTFMKKIETERRNNIKRLIRAIEEDDIEGYQKAIGIDFGDKFERERAIRNCVTYFNEITFNSGLGSGKDKSKNIDRELDDIVK